MIKPKYFNHENCNPICIDGVTVPVEIKNLAALSPSFPPTPTKRQPPDGNILHAELMKLKRSLAWKVHFRRRKDFKEADTLEDFINMEHQLFVKHPWYIPSTKSPPPLPFLLDEAFSNVYRTVMDPANWYHYSQNVTLEMRIAISKTRALPSQGVGVYCQDKSSRIVFASLATTNSKVETVLSDETKYQELDCDHALIYQPQLSNWYRRYKSA